MNGVEGHDRSNLEWKFGHDPRGNHGGAYDRFERPGILLVRKIIPCLHARNYLVLKAIGELAKEVKNLHGD